jgi:hypothetical protein
MSGALPKTDEAYLTKCQNTLRQKYGEPAYILITQKADPANYPNGAWFDEYVNKPLQIAGVDEDTMPQLYIMPNGNAVPFSCAELLLWLPPARRHHKKFVKMNDGLLQERKLCGQREIMEMLRLAFPDIPDDAELVISQSSPFLFADGAMLWLELYRYPVDDYVVEFVAGIHKTDGGRFYVIALDNGLGGCISLTKKPRDA